MSSVSQLIPNYILGVSDQPDELKRPGQLREATNTYPDVTFGLQKRPGFQFLRNLESIGDGDGAWFSYFRSNSTLDREEYIGHISKTGRVYVWSAKTGTPMDVAYAKETANVSTVVKMGSNTRELTDDELYLPSDPNYNNVYIPYLKHTVPSDLRTLTVNDFTFLANRKVPVTMSQTKTGAVIDADGNTVYEAFVDIRTLAYSRQYTLKFTEIDESKSKTNATEVKIVSETYGSDTVCTAGGTTVTLADGDDKTGLKVTLTTTCKLVNGESVHRTTVSLDAGGEGWKVGDTVTTSTTHGDFTVKVTKIQNIEESVEIGEAFMKTPTSASTVVTVDGILEDLMTDATNAISKITHDDDGDETTDEVPVFTTKQIGNGLLITRPSKPFSVETPETDLFNILSPTEDEDVNIPYTATADVNNLPSQCKQGLVCKVTNSADSADDYYVKFVGNLDADGPGAWEETVRPGLYNSYNSSSMPHQIVRSSSTREEAGETIVRFVVSDVDYDSREVGDQDSNPGASFAPTKDEADGQTINNMLFFRNRLVFLSQENVIMSRPNDFFNFWAVSAISSSPKDPIDIAASTTYASTLVDGIGINNGLVLFSEFQQFLLTTDSDVLDNDTAKITPIGAYDFNIKTFPFRMGNTFGFLSTTKQHSMMLEMADVFREGEPVVVEASTIIKKRIPADLELIATSRENGFLGFAKRNGTDVTVFRYFNNGNERALSSWVKWDLPGELLYQVIIDDNYYMVVKQGATISLLNSALRSDYVTESVQGQEFEYHVHLDYNKVIKAADVTYDSDTRTSSFDVPIPIFAGKALSAFTVTSGDNNGGFVQVTVDGTKGTIPGDWSSDDVVVGYPFTMKIEFPTLYVAKSDGKNVRSQTTKSLIIHRLELSLGATGVYTTTIGRDGMDDYTFLHDQRPMDLYEADSIAVSTETIQTIPCYTRNTALDVMITSTHPSPATLFSMTWEGDFSNRFYQNV